MPNFNFLELANVAYGLLYTDAKDRDLWKAFAKNVSTQEYSCPLIYYTPLKIARYYMDILFPEWDYKHYENTCFQAERYYSITKLNHDYDRYQENHDISRALNLQLKLDDITTVFMEFENLYYLDFAFMPYKVGILVLKERDYMPYSDKPRAAFQLREKILKANDWELMILKYTDYQALGPKRVDWLKAELDKLLKKREYKVKEDDLKRKEGVFTEFMDNLWKESDENRKRTLDRHSLLKETA